MDSSKSSSDRRDSSWPVLLIRVSNLPETWYALGGIEPLAYAASAAVALAVALVAGLPSARRAIKINPIQAMRSK